MFSFEAGHTSFLDLFYRIWESPARMRQLNNEDRVRDEVVSQPWGIPVVCYLAPRTFVRIPANLINDVLIKLKGDDGQFGGDRPCLAFEDNYHLALFIYHSLPDSTKGRVRECYHFPQRELVEMYLDYPVQPVLSEMLGLKECTDFERAWYLVQQWPVCFKYVRYRRPRGEVELIRRRLPTEDEVREFPKGNLRELECSIREIIRREGLDTPQKREEYGLRVLPVFEEVKWLAFLGQAVLEHDKDARKIVGTWPQFRNGVILFGHVRIPYADCHLTAAKYANKKFEFELRVLRGHRLCDETTTTDDD